MDLQQCSLSTSQSSSSCSSNGNGNGNKSCMINGEVKKCSDCQTTTTPLWRGGPAGPKTLCNACGIKYHKKRRALLGVEKGKVDKLKKPNNSMKNDGNAPIRMPIKIKVMASGMRQSDKIGEVEQAALLLMALSYGSVYA